MLKKLCLTLLTFSSIAMARETDLRLECANQEPFRKGESIGWITGLSLIASVYPGHDVLRDAVATAEILEDYNEMNNDPIRARIQYLRPDEEYKPRKKRFLNHNRYELMQMVDIVHFGRFLPGMECSIEVYLPKELNAGQTFIAPVLLHCDQDGGRANMQCRVNATP